MSHAVYRLTPGEYGRYRTHLLALDETSRYLRFGYQIRDEVIEQLCDKFESNHRQHKLFVIENDNLDVIAAGHISLEGDELELAFSVLKEYQGQGMGSSLMARTVEWCQNRGIKGGCMVCISTNTAIKKLAAKHGILVNDHGETLADIKIPAATTASVVHELAVSNIAKFDHLGKLQRRFAQMLTLPLFFK